MRKVLTTVFVLLAIAGPAAAQDDRPVGVNVGFGWTFPTGNFADSFDAGWNGGWNEIHGPDSLDPQGVGDLWNMPGECLTYSDPEFSWQAVQVPTGVNFPFGTSW